MRARRARCKRVLDANGYAMVLAEHHYDLDAEVRITEQLISHGVDAFVFVGLYHDPALFALLESYGRPYVLTWGVDPMRRHPSHRLRQPRRDVRDDAAPDRARPPPLRPAERGDRRATTARRERGAGMRAALAQAGLALDERYAQYGPIDLDAGDRDDATSCSR